MGCDIHYFVEVQQEDNSWKVLGIPSWRDYKTLKEWEEVCPKWHYEHRNYSTFAVLANVRNGRGFAGSDLGNPVTPISEPKGLPPNVSTKVKVASDNYGRDGHSHSYLTVRELLNYNWNALQTVREVIQLEDYERFLKTGERDWSWACSSVYGKKHLTVTNDEAKGILSGEIPRQDGFSYYTKVQYQIPIKETCQYFHDTVIPALVELGDPDRVRIVFFFDN